MKRYSFRQQLPKMLSAIVKEHQSKQAVRKEKQGKICELFNSILKIFMMISKYNLFKMREMI